MRHLMSLVWETTWFAIVECAKIVVPLTNHDKKLIQEFRTSVTSTQSGQRAVNTEWQNNLNAIYDTCLHMDPRFFLSWITIRKTMFLSSEEIIGTEFRSVKKTIKNRNITEDHFGFPLPYILWPKMSTNLIHLLYHYFSYEFKTKQHIKTMDLIVEFGGGYGGLCKLIYQSGFSGKYVIYDLPLFSALQKYYLKALGYSVSSSFDKPGKIYCISSLKELKSLMKNTKRSDKRLFIATWSLSESPLSVREAFEPLLKQFNYYLVAYQDQFEQVDNMNYFKRFKSLTGAQHNLLYHLKHIPNSYYMFGYSD